MVEWKKLGEICEIKTGKGITQKDCSEEGVYPVISGGQTPMGMYSHYNRDAETVTISRVGAYAGFVSFIHVKFYLNDKCFSIIPLIEELNKKFLFCILKGKEGEIKKLQSEGGVPTINTQKLGKLIIPIPPLSEQQRIVGILDTFTASIDNLKEQIAQRRKQYEYYRDQLLDLEGKPGVEMKTLGEICDTLSGFPFDSTKFRDSGIQLMRGANIKRGFFDFSPDLNKYWESSAGLEKYLLEANDIIISMDGSLVGKSFCYLRSEHLPLLLVQRVARIRTKGNYKYLYYYITKSFPDYVDKKKTAGAIPHISMKDINSFIVPLPSFREQSRIVGILDTFEASIQNLEAQLKEREKQYEYYRNKLLTFE